jgi:spore germination cell wall hydrolase CwlJ-like protein
LRSSYAEEASGAIAYAPAPDRTPNAAAVEAIQRMMFDAGEAQVAAAPQPATMSALLRERRDAIVPEVPQISAAERRCLATAIYFEARGEPQSGQEAVAQVVLNRTRSGTYPDTICGVVYQNQHRRNACQFSFACDGTADRISEPRAWAVAESIANAVAEGRQWNTTLATATHYHASYVSPPWAPRMQRLTKIGHHIFYYEKGRMLWGG